MNPKKAVLSYLAIAASILEATGQATALPEDAAVIGELGLDGDVLAIRGIIGKLNRYLCRPTRD